jgi:SAM-dependent methyltransferase
VLDAACGTGYGTALLAEAGAARVDGFDRCLDAVAFAARTYARPEANFAVARVDRLPVPDRSYDIYVSFETIEHVDDETLLAEAARVLCTGGLFLVSTPNRDLLDAGTSIEQKPFNRFHIREYTRAELESRLRRHFSSVEWYGQTPFSSAYVTRLGHVGRSWPALAVRIHQANKVLHWPWETPARHIPARYAGINIVPEVLIAVCYT